ncbi:MULTISPECIES: DUF2381 family protein [unclassified Corallococcus]|uniref:DUF2381 family protein n=1 Tax=unclassified Corallococcus TaxID=2685029 RepID=UPI001A8D966F|nr:MULTISPECIES: DUF2381 family protein [unclassified Corallococcus]MBN9681105.1 DUF2381 family protein [Corallococcus sp. NCSPR001]WAS87301.1 DUF2381 family protein [Corallococcus sp. NCRR]
MLLFLLPFLAAADGGVSDDTATLLSEQSCPDVGLAAILSTAVLGQGGVQTLQLKAPETGASGAMFQVRSFRSARRVAVQLEFSVRTPLPSKAAKASLRGPNHQTLRVVEVLEVASGSEAESAQIIVEAEAQSQEARGVYTLELQDAEGAKLLVLPGVRFPSI